MSIVVTGATGHLGRLVVEALLVAAGHTGGHVSTEQLRTAGCGRNTPARRQRNRRSS
jgi:hypothetical protein